MYRTQYDHDVAMFSPQGRIHQIEYAMEAVKQGSATLGIKSKKHVVLAGFRRTNDDFSLHQDKIFEVDSHIGMSVAGITCDSRVLRKHMRVMCANYRYAYSSLMPSHRLVCAISDKMHKPTMLYGQRPFGVGALVAAYDDSGAHLYQLCPSANCFDCVAMSIGARSQSIKTYLEKHIESFEEASLDQLVEHAVLALRDSLQSSQTLTAQTCAIAAVGAEMPFTIFSDSLVGDYVSRVLQTIPSEDAPQQPPPTSAPQTAVE